jgi:hypothetical protein
VRYTLVLLSLAIGLFSGMLILFEIGRRAGVRSMSRDSDGSHVGTGAIDSAVLGLMGLLVGFTFFGAAGRFDDRRNLIVDETNIIGTAYLRLDLLPVATQPAVKQLFREYLDSRLAFYQNITDPNISGEEDRKTKILQQKIWEEAVAAARSPETIDGGRLLLPALNDMIDITTTRAMATRMHPPLIVFAMLFGMSFASALLAGYEMAKAKRRNWHYATGFALIMAVVVYVILDLEFPRLGFLRVDAFDEALLDLRNSMK